MKINSKNDRPIENSLWYGPDEKLEADLLLIFKIKEPLRIIITHNMKHRVMSKLIKEYPYPNEY
jgi:hypothetical protein